MPRETESLEKVQKNQVLNKNTNKEDSSAHPQKRQKILMHGIIITNSDYQTQIAEKALVRKNIRKLNRKKKKAKKKKNLKKKPNKARKGFRETLFVDDEKRHY